MTFLHEGGKISSGLIKIFIFSCYKNRSDNYFIYAIVHCFKISGGGECRMWFEYTSNKIKLRISPWFIGAVTGLISTIIYAVN